MSLKLACIPAALLLAVALGCDSKPKDPVPTTAPAALKAGEEHKILDHLRYMAVRKMPAHAKVVAPILADAKVQYGQTCWMHSHTGALGTSLTDAEMTALGVADLKNLGVLAPNVSKKDLQDANKAVAEKKADKLPEGMGMLTESALDTLPNDGDPNRKVEFDFLKEKNLFEPLAAAGVYRVAKSIPDEVWRAISIQETKTNPAIKEWTDIYLKFETAQVAKITVGPRKDGTLALVYVEFKMSGAKLKKIAEALKTNTPAK